MATAWSSFMKGEEVVSFSTEFTSGSSSDILLTYTMPRAEYMYGCTATTVGMLLGYYDLYGYCVNGTNYSFSNLISGNISVNSRGSDGGSIYDMNDPSALAGFIASEDYLERFYRMTPDQELEYSFIYGDPANGLNVSVYNCLADWLGTGQYWRGNGDLSTRFYYASLEWLYSTSQTYTVHNGSKSFDIPVKYVDFKYGLSKYVESTGYKLNAEETRTYSISNFSFEKFMAEIDAGRPVLVSLSSNAGGHSVIAYGYNASTKEIIFDDTYRHDCRMSWSGTYEYSSNTYSIRGATTVVFEISGEGTYIPGEWSDNYDAVMTYAKANNVPVLLYYGNSDFCRYCKSLEEQVFMTGEFSTYVNSGSVALLKNVDVPGISHGSIPTCILLDSNGKVLDSRVGYASGHQAAWLSWFTKYVSLAEPDTEAPVLSGLPSAVVDNYSVTISWNAAQDNIGVSGYKLILDEDKVIDVGNHLSYIIDNESIGDHTCKLAAYDAAGNLSDYSGIRAYTVYDVTAPTLPWNLSMSLNGHAAKFEWSGSSDNVGVAGYEFRYGTSSALSGNGIKVTSCDYLLSEIAPGTYYWQVRAYDAAGNYSMWSSTAEFTIAEPDTEAPVLSGLPSAVVDNYSVTISWNAAQDNIGVSGYKLILDEDKVIDVGNHLSYIIDNESIGDHTCKLAAYDAAGNLSDYSGIRAYTVYDVTAPTLPWNLSMSLNGHAAKFEWSGSSDNVGVAGYEFRYGTSSALSGNGIKVTSCDYLLSEIAPGTYYWQVRAYDVAGNYSMWSSTAEFTIAEQTRLIECDFDANGLSDVVMFHDVGFCGAWQVQQNQKVEWNSLSTLNSSWKILGTGHTDHNNCSDVYLYDGWNVGAWNIEEGKVTSWKTIGNFDDKTQVLGIGDFNGDGVSDLLQRNVNGAVGCYMTDGKGWNYFQSLGNEWKIAAVGDLNGDGLSDIVLHHTTGGFAGSWLTQENGSVEWANLDTLNSGFEIVGCGDFNGDGIDDVLLKNGNYYGAWLVKGGSASDWMGLGFMTAGNVVEQIGDFSGDGVDDLRIRTDSGSLGALLVQGEDNLKWSYYGSVGKEWGTALSALK